MQHYEISFTDTLIYNKYLFFDASLKIEIEVESK